MNSYVTELNSSTSASGPQYYLVATAQEREDNPRSYLQSQLSYQVQALKAYLQSSGAPRQTGLLDAPVSQINTIVAQNLETFVTKLEPFVFLYDGWNGEGSRSPSSLGIWQAVFDSFRLIAIGLPAPSPKLLSDGTLGVFWRLGQRYAAIDFEEDGVHVWTVTDGQTFKSGTWDAAGEVPRDLKVVATDEPSTRAKRVFAPMRERDT